MPVLRDFRSDQFCYDRQRRTVSEVSQKADPGGRFSWSIFRIRAFDGQQLADLRDQGQSLQQVYDWAEQHKLELNHWFFSTDLTFYIKGGRISKTAGFIGGVLNICPLLNMDDQGRLIPRFKIRTKKKVIRTIVDKMEEYARDGRDYSGKCYISQSGCYEDARAVADLVEARFPHLNGKVLINYVGTTIGSHTGPGTVALFFWGKKRTE